MKSLQALGKSLLEDSKMYSTPFGNGPFKISGMYVEDARGNTIAECNSREITKLLYELLMKTYPKKVSEAKDSDVKKKLYAEKRELWRVAVAAIRDAGGTVKATASAQMLDAALKDRFADAKKHRGSPFSPEKYEAAKKAVAAVAAIVKRENEMGPLI